MSVLTVPVSVNLASIENELNKRVPDHLETIDERGQICVEAEWLKTKGIPKCRVKDWYKLYCEDTWLKTKVTPDITCDVSGWVKRDGAIRLSGSGKTLTVSIPVKAKITAQGRGEIGKNITQTVEGATLISATLLPDITDDWMPTMEVDTSFTWTDRPNFKLFNLIPITVGSKAEPELRQVLDEFEGSVPNLLTEAKIKEQIAVAWADIQKPTMLSKKQRIWGRFAPDGIGFSGIDVNSNVLNATFLISGYPKVSVGAEEEDGALLPLPALTRIDRQNPKIEVALPIQVDLAHLEAMGEEYFEELGPIDLDEYDYNYVLEISDIDIESDGETLHLAVDFTLSEKGGFWNTIDVFGFLDVEGRVSFFARPSINEAHDIVSLSKVSYDSETDNPVADMLVNIAKLAPIRELVRKSISYDFSSEVDGLRRLAGDELNGELSDQVRLTGRVDDISIGEIDLAEKYIRIPVNVSGALEVLVGI